MLPFASFYPFSEPNERWNGRTDWGKGSNKSTTGGDFFTAFALLCMCVTVAVYVSVDFSALRCLFAVSSLIWAKDGNSVQSDNEW